jgi:hypothetical protein
MNRFADGQNRNLEKSSCPSSNPRTDLKGLQPQNEHGAPTTMSSPRHRLAESLSNLRNCREAGRVEIEDRFSDNCHENGESAHEKSTTYEQLAIFMLRGALEAHAAPVENSHYTPSKVASNLFGINEP